MLVVASVIPNRLLRVHHVARRLQKSVRTIRWYAQTGKLVGVRNGKLWFFDPDIVEAFRLRQGIDRAA